MLLRSHLSDVKRGTEIDQYFFDALVYQAFEVLVHLSKLAVFSIQCREFTQGIYGPLWLPRVAVLVAGIWYISSGYQ